MDLSAEGLEKLIKLPKLRDFGARERLEAQKLFIYNQKKKHTEVEKNVEKKQRKSKVRGYLATRKLLREADGQGSSYNR